MAEVRALTKLDDDPKAPSCATCVQRPDCTAFAAYTKRYLDMTNIDDVDAAFLGIHLAHGVICDDWRSMFIDYPITVDAITVDQVNTKQVDVGRPAIITLGKTNGYDDAAHVAIYLGQLPISVVSAYAPSTRRLSNRLLLNPCLLVPRYARLFFGMNAQWSLATRRSIDTVDDADKELPEYRWAVDWLLMHGDVPQGKFTGEAHN